MISVSEE